MPDHPTKIPESPVTEVEMEEVVKSIDHFNRDNREATADVARTIAESTGALSRAVNRIDRHAEEQLEIITELGTKDITERSQQAAARTDALDGINKTLQDVLVYIKAADAKNSANDLSRKAYNLALAVAVFTGVATVAAIGTWITAIVQVIQAAQGNQSPPKTGDSSLDSALGNLYTVIVNTSDDEFWSQSATYIGMKRDWTLYLSDQLVMMNYAIDWFPNYGTWTWASGQDKVQFVQQLVAAYGTSNDSVYTTVNAFSYAGDETQPGVAVKIPRAVGADLVRLALARIIADANDIK